MSLKHPSGFVSNYQSFAVAVPHLFHKVAGASIDTT